MEVEQINTTKEVRKYRETHEPIDESVDAITFYREEIFADRNVIKYDDNDNVLSVEKMSIGEFNDMFERYREAGYSLEDDGDDNDIPPEYRGIKKTPRRVSELI